MRADCAQTAERGDEDADDSAAQEARAARINVVIDAQVIEQLAEDERYQQEEETDRGNSQENQEW